MRKDQKKDFLELSRKPLKLLILLTKLVARVTRLELVTLLNKNNYLAPHFTFMLSY